MNQKKSYAIDENEFKTSLSLSKSFFSDEIIETEQSIIKLQDKINLKLGAKEVETGLAPPSLCDLQHDKKLGNMLSPTLQVAKVIKVLPSVNNNPRYMISIKQMAKFIVEKSKRANITEEITEGMRVAVERTKYSIIKILPRKIDASVTLMQIEERPDVSYADIGGCKKEIEQVKEVVEEPLLNPEKFINLGIDPPKGILLYGPPGTGKTLLARAVANRSDACFIRVVGSELVQKYIGEGARMVREIFKLAKSKKSCIIFFDEVDVFGGTRFGNGDDNEVQRTMLEVINQLDGFDARGHVKIIMATNRPDTLDPALLRPGRLDRKIEVGLPDLEGRVKIFEINAKKMSIEKGIRFELLARMCDGTTGAEIRSVCIEAGMFAIRERRKIATEEDFFKAVDKVIKLQSKFSATPKYLTYN